MTKNIRECGTLKLGLTHHMRRIAPIVLLAAVACSKSAPPQQQAASPTQPAPAAQADPLPVATDAQKQAATNIVGTTPPEWKAERWMGSPPLTLASLRGSVVLVRWWTAGCPFCSTTAPSLRNFHTTYGDRGLRVIGLYHHKEDTPFDPAVYEETARKYGFTFPVAFDPDWHTLGAWMRDSKGKEVSTGWTSVTFLLDKKGVVRHVHPGGHYVEGDPAHAEMQRTIEKLLAER
jgi:peroxiredoxin